MRRRRWRRGHRRRTRFETKEEVETLEEVKTEEETETVREVKTEEEARTLEDI